jgi:hypothetical protein
MLAAFLACLAVLVASCGAPRPGSDCVGYYDPAVTTCFARADDAGRRCGDSSECEYFCACPEDEADLGECSPFPYAQYCALTNGSREMVVH